LQSEKWLDNFFDAKIVNEFFEKEHILVDVDKFATEDLLLEKTLSKAKTIEGCISFVALKGMLVLDIDIDARFV
jgi:hypothetical protein